MTYQEPGTLRRRAVEIEKQFQDLRPDECLARIKCKDRAKDLEDLRTSAKVEHNELKQKLQDMHRKLMEARAAADEWTDDTPGVARSRLLPMKLAELIALAEQIGRQEKELQCKIDEAESAAQQAKDHRDAVISTRKTLRNQQMELKTLAEQTERQDVHRSFEPWELKAFDDLAPKRVDETVEQMQARFFRIMTGYGTDETLKLKKGDVTHGRQMQIVAGVQTCSELVDSVVLTLAARNNERSQHGRVPDDGGRFRHEDVTAPDASVPAVTPQSLTRQPSPIRSADLNPTSGHSASLRPVSSGLVPAKRSATASNDEEHSRSNGYKKRYPNRQNALTHKIYNPDSYFKSHGIGKI